MNGVTVERVYDSTSKRSRFVFTTEVGGTKFWRVGKFKTAEEAERAGRSIQEEFDREVEDTED